MTRLILGDSSVHMTFDHTLIFTSTSSVLKSVFERFGYTKYDIFAIARGGDGGNGAGVGSVTPKVASGGGGGGGGSGACFIRRGVNISTLPNVATINFDSSGAIEGPGFFLTKGSDGGHASTFFGGGGGAGGIFLPTVDGVDADLGPFNGHVGTGDGAAGGVPPSDLVPVGFGAGGTGGGFPMTPDGFSKPLYTTVSDGSDHYTVSSGFGSHGAGGGGGGRGVLTTTALRQGYGCRSGGGGNSIEPGFSSTIDTNAYASPTFLGGYGGGGGGGIMLDVNGVSTMYGFGGSGGRGSIGAASPAPAGSAGYPGVVVMVLYR